jgi:hypothetical protein
VRHLVAGIVSATITSPNPRKLLDQGDKEEPPLLFAFRSATRDESHFIGASTSSPTM